MQQKLKLFLRVIRFYQPTGFLLLMWPAICSLFLASNNFPNYQILILFVLGSFFIRSAGCIINDIIDKDFDKYVARTKNRPIASGELTVRQAMNFLFILLLGAFIILINFNRLAITIGFLALLPIVIYPFLKRYIHFPQLFLGFTFNLGVILAFAAINNNLSLAAFLFYGGCVFWTLGYDTIYAYQDITDDKILGLKSSAIKLGNSPKRYIYFFYLMFMFLTASALVLSNINYQKLLFLLLPSIHILLQLKKFNPNDPTICGNIFRSNGFTGFLLLIALILIKL